MTEGRNYWNYRNHFAFTAKHDKWRGIRKSTRHETGGDWNRTSWRARTTRTKHVMALLHY